MSILAEPYFPPVNTADEEGLLMFGGALSVENLLTAYHRGIFPWPLVDNGVEILSWWSPDPRAVIEFDDFHVSRRLARRLRRQEFRVTFNQAFSAVVQGCSQRQDDLTWITRDMQRAYETLFDEGYAHSVEVWQNGDLVGGLYGVALGGFFAGESMFHRATDASKVALYHLIERLKERDFSLFDIQLATDHTLSLGAREIPRRRFLRRLRSALKVPTSFT